MVKPETGQAKRLEKTVRSPAVGVLGVDHAVGQRERGLEAVGQPLADAFAHHQPVHHRLDLVLDLAVERRHLADLVERAVHLHAGEAPAL